MGVVPLPLLLLSVLAAAPVTGASGVYVVGPGTELGRAPPPALPGFSLDALASTPDPSPSEWAQMTIKQRIVIRVPMIGRTMPEAPADRAYEKDDPPSIPDTDWVERKGPKCVDIRRVRAAAITSDRGIDLMLRGHGRVRALLGRGCRPADLYSGFYIQPNADGAFCAGRDRMLARSGADCEITELVRLVPDD